MKKNARQAPDPIRELFTTLSSHDCVTTLKDNVTGASINVRGNPVLHVFDWSSSNLSNVTGREDVVSTVEHSDASSTEPETSAPIHIHLGSYGEGWNRVTAIEITGNHASEILKPRFSYVMRFWADKTYGLLIYIDEPLLTDIRERFGEFELDRKIGLDFFSGARPPIQ